VNRDTFHLGADHTDDLCWHGRFLKAPFRGPNETRNNRGLQAFSGQRALPVCNQAIGKRDAPARAAPVAVVNVMNYEGWELGKIAAGDAVKG